MTSGHIRDEEKHVGTLPDEPGTETAINVLRRAMYHAGLDVDMAPNLLKHLAILQHGVYPATPIPRGL